MHSLSNFAGQFVLPYLASGVVVPIMLGVRGTYNDTAAEVTNVDLSWDGIWSEEPVAGSNRALYIEQVPSGDAEDLPSGFTLIGSVLPRLNSSLGNNYRTMFAEKVLDSTDIAAKKIVIPNIGARTPAFLVAFKNVTTFTRSPQWLRSAEFAANQQALPVMTVAAPAIVIAWGGRGSGLRPDPSYSAGYTVLNNQQSATTGSRYAGCLGVCEVESGNTPTADWIVGGTANMTMTTEVIAAT
jgi:hypothetical protein